MITSKGNAADVWRQYVRTRREEIGSPTQSPAFADATKAVLALDPTDRVAILHEALRGRDRLSGIALLRRLPEEEVRQLFSDLVFLASFSHGAIEPVRDAIASLEQAWVLERIEKTAEPLLRHGDWDTYRRLLELYTRLDRHLMIRLAERASTETDESTREAGAEFLESVADGPSDRWSLPTSTHPVAGFLIAWAQFERQYAMKMETERLIRPNGPALLRIGLLASKEQADEFDRLRYMRNRLVHAGEVPPATQLTDATATLLELAERLQCISVGTVDSDA